MRASVQRLVLIALVLCAVPAVSGHGPPRSTASLADLRGVVLDVGHAAGEGDLDVLTVTLDTDGALRTVLLGPESVLDEVGFDVEPGDTLRVRVFVDPDSESLAAQRVLNVSRKSMMRLRTLHRDPLWDTAGRWQGGSTFGRGPEGGGRGRGQQNRGGGQRQR